MKREELKPMPDLFLDMGVDVEGNRNYQPWTAYDKDEADQVMDAMEKDNKDLRHNLEDWKAENEALKQHIKELESDLSTMEVSYEALIRNWVNVAKDTELRLQYHIEELEETKAKMYDANQLMNANIKELEATISILETTAPKWISVGDRLPNEKEQYELLWVGYVRTDNTIKYVYEASFDYETKQFYTENDWGDKTFIEPDIWMVVPPPPTTEEK